ncbi:MAG TPA: hypothetical protein VIO64_01135 [Pseudobacteroides sp.]|uniref:hypothetical protein n=1 Tax=Pseudobacteroides sp. TaxID=1968840 RepID=UPI002F945120
MAVLLLQANRQIPRSIYAIIKAALLLFVSGKLWRILKSNFSQQRPMLQNHFMILLCSIIACVSQVLFLKKHLLASEITEVLRFKPLDLMIALSIILLIIFFSTLAYLILFLEIAFMLNILIIILFQRIKVPNISI